MTFFRERQRQSLTLGLGTVPTMARSWPKVKESAVEFPRSKEKVTLMAGVYLRVKVDGQCGKPDRRKHNACEVKNIQIANCRPISSHPQYISRTLCRG